MPLACHHDTSMQAWVFPWVSYGFVGLRWTVMMPWDCHGTVMALPWDCHGTIMGHETVMAIPLTAMGCHAMSWDHHDCHGTIMALWHVHGTAVECHGTAMG